MDSILELLKDNIDIEYAAFQQNLLPNIAKEQILGVRTPILKKIAKTIAEGSECEEFLNKLPHYYFEENQLHALIISAIKDPDTCVRRYKEFVPFIDNWATCDQLLPKVFKKQPEIALGLAEDYVASDKTYTIRTGVGILMRYYLDGAFEPRFLEIVAGIKSEEYYVNMMRAWYFATALAKQYDATVKIIESKKLDRWTHNKSIQKAVESYRVPEDHKQYLRTCRI